MHSCGSKSNALNVQFMVITTTASDVALQQTFPNSHKWKHHAAERGVETIDHDFHQFHTHRSWFGIVQHPTPTSTSSNLRPKWQHSHVFTINGTFHITSSHRQALFVNGSAFAENGYGSHEKCGPINRSIHLCTFNAYMCVWKCMCVCQCEHYDRSIK